MTATFPEICFPALRTDFDDPRQISNQELSTSKENKHNLYILQIFSRKKTNGKVRGGLFLEEEPSTQNKIKKGQSFIASNYDSFSRCLAVLYQSYFSTS